MKANAVPKGRFKIINFKNRTGSQSWRVTGTRRNGDRIRENFQDDQSAQCRQLELEAEWHMRKTEQQIRSTKLTETQIGIAETCFCLVEDDTHVLTAVRYWIANGKLIAPKESPKLDDAFEQYKTWMQSPDCKMRPLSKMAAKTRVNAFVNSTSNLQVASITTENVEKFLDLFPTLRTRLNYRHGVSHFFNWCIDRPRRWLTVNPCKLIKIRVGHTEPPKVLPIADCEKLMAEAQTFDDGALLPYLTLTLFEGLRPFEARRMKWDHINFADREIRIEGWQTKTKRPRSFTLDDRTMKWLNRCKDLPIFPANFANRIPVLMKKIGYGAGDGLKKWPKDFLRHTAISHFFRNTGSYGLTAERFGNSEAIIKKHYQGRVTSAETKKFYALMPKKGQSK